MADEFRKPSALIHIAHNTTLLQAKIWDFVLSKTPFDDIINKQMHQLPISEIINFLGNTRNRKHVHALLEDLTQTYTYTILKGNKSEEWGCFPLFDFICIKDAMFNYSFPSCIKKAFANQIHYSTVKLSMLRKFECKYALFLYFLCLDYKNIMQTPWLAIQEFYAYMGIALDSYHDIGTLNYHVVKKAVSEVNKKTDLKIVPRYQLDGRKIKEIKFHVLSKDGMAQAKLNRFMRAL